MEGGGGRKQFYYVLREGGGAEGFGSVNITDPNLSSFSFFFFFFFFVIIYQIIIGISPVLPDKVH